MGSTSTSTSTTSSSSSSTSTSTRAVGSAIAAWVDLQLLHNPDGVQPNNAVIPPASTRVGNGRSCYALKLQPNQAYTIGRSNLHAHFVFRDPRISKLHCQILFDASLRRLYILNGAFSVATCYTHSDSIYCLLHGFRSRLIKFSGEEDENKVIADLNAFACKGLRFRASLNGLSINEVRIGKGLAMQLSVDDVVTLVCGNRHGVCGSRPRVGFIAKSIFIEEGIGRGRDDVLFDRPRSFGPMSISQFSKRIFSMSASDSESFKSEFDVPIGRAKTLLTCCRRILDSDDPISYIRRRININSHMDCDNAWNFKANEIPSLCVRLKPPASDEPHVETYMTRSRRQNSLCDTLPMNRTLTTSGGADTWPVSIVIPCEKVAPLKPIGEYSCSRRYGVALEKVYGANIADVSRLKSMDENKLPILNNSGENNCRNKVISPPGKNFYLNRLINMEHSVVHKSVSLPEILYPIESITRMFIATFTCNILWFLSYCQIPTHLPITVACHNTERCWSSAVEQRTSVPYPDFPNLVVVYPPFPEAIAFGKDCTRKGIACHHPKLLLLQREDSMRVVITSANLVSQQWNNVTNTVWWQDFPRADSPDYSSLFTQISGKDANGDRPSDFASQLAGFIATLLCDVPSKAKWIADLAWYDFKEATGYLIASVPGVYSQRTRIVTDPMRSFPANQLGLSLPDRKFLGSVQASVVGLRHLFRTRTDTKGAQLRKLAGFLGNHSGKICEISEVVLRRNKNVPADSNAVAILISDPNASSEGDCVHLGFLPRNFAKWVSPLWDNDLFRFSGYILPKEALAAAVGGTNEKVQLILHVSQGPNFQDMSKMIQPEYIVALCSLIASLERSTGLWRLEEVLTRYQWPENLETDFIYGASSIGSSVNPQFLSTFSSAVGKRSTRSFDSDESDPEWGCWSASQELKNPSMRVVFPTIDRVKNARNGVLCSKYILSFDERTWQQVKRLQIIHDAVPHPSDRVGHPMHVKVARRSFKPKMDGSSFGWVYCGSHNLSAAAWGRPVSIPSDGEVNGPEKGNNSTLKLQVHNYELGIIFIFPPPETKGRSVKGLERLDDIVLPFVVPAPKYGLGDRPATKQAMREALAELAVQQTETLIGETSATQEMMDEIPDEEVDVNENAQYVAQENEEENAYAEILWSQVDSSQCC